MITDNESTDFYFPRFRSSIKSLLDKASHEPIDGNSPEVLNFCAVLEHILSHRLRRKSFTIVKAENYHHLNCSELMNITLLISTAVHRWYGTDESRWFWDYIKTACTRVPHSCLSSIESIDKPKTARGKVFIQ